MTLEGLDRATIGLETGTQEIAEDCVRLGHFVYFMRTDCVLN